MKKKWVVADQEVLPEIRHLASDLNIDLRIARLLVNRGIDTFEKARSYFRPTLQSLYDPFLMKDMSLAVDRLYQAIKHKEKIRIYGDYDVDGTTSVSLVFSFLTTLGVDVDYYIPDRYLEGYGVSEKGIHSAANDAVKLLITLDCGIKGHQSLTLARSLGIDVIICDHHLTDEYLPTAVAVLDPKRTDCTYPYKHLSGCGVGFKLLQGLCLRYGYSQETLLQYIDLVAVSIASDIVPITDENRILAFHGLKKLNEDPLPGLQALSEVAGLKSEISISDIVFYLGPRINATGRLQHASESVKLLVSKDTDVLSSFAGRLQQVNQNRREFDNSMTQEALEMIAEEYYDSRSTVLFHPKWHKGVVGIVASRCIESYYRPTVILTESNGKATGSARSIAGFDLYEAIASCADLLDQFGGHTHAAGLSMPVENVEPFRIRFEKLVAEQVAVDDQIPKLQIDLQVDFDFLTPKNYRIIKQMAPFGPWNQEPILISEKVYLKHMPRLLKEQHLKLELYQERTSTIFDAIGFGLGHFADYLRMDVPFRIAYHLSENTFNERTSLQLMLKDIKFYD